MQGLNGPTSQLRPEKPWFAFQGRGFNSRHLHQVPVGVDTSTRQQALFHLCAIWGLAREGSRFGTKSLVRAFCCARKLPLVEGVLGCASRCWVGQGLPRRRKYAPTPWPWACRIAISSRSAKLRQRPRCHSAIHNGIISGSVCLVVAACRALFRRAPARPQVFVWAPWPPLLAHGGVVDSFDVDIGVGEDDFDTDAA